ncbi:hypothetical protein KFE25_001425 [Diacronema lutheri]|uniref:Seipin n=1 Tax=Diacronema lutheri TaxID=2081491 RepID=A0A8J5XIJ7_DIALT|nr:hypothetical protein KFE25_001425 [Diacronema lutheri]
MAGPEPPPAGGSVDWDTVALWGERVVTYSVRFWMIFVLASTAAVAAYLMIYRAVVPDASHVVPLFFAFDNGAPPAADVALDGPIMAPGHAYALSLVLEMPESPANCAAGNFMVELAVHAGHSNRTLASVRRPGILRFRSGLVHSLWTVAFLPLLLLGRAEERQAVRVPLIELFDNPRKEPAARARVSLSKPSLQLYSAQLHVDAVFRGLSYYMHTHRLATALVFISAIVVVQFVLIALLQFRGRAAAPALGRDGSDGERLDEAEGAELSELSSGDEAHYPPRGAAADAARPRRRRQR